MTRDEVKAEYQAYRQRADDFYAGSYVIIRHDAAVQVVEGGAFVEAFVWVPKESKSK